MPMLSEDDLNLRELTADEIDAAWDLWFDLAQATNDADRPYTHGVFAGSPRVSSPAVDDAALRGRESDPSVSRGAGS